MNVVSLCKSRNIVELEFEGTDMLGLKMIASTELRPLVHLRQVHFLNCRQITMRSAANVLPSFRGNMPSFEIAFTTWKDYNEIPCVIRIQLPDCHPSINNFAQQTEAFPLYKDADTITKMAPKCIAITTAALKFLTGLTYGTSINCSLIAW